MLASKFFLNINILFIFNLLILSCVSIFSNESEDVFITYMSNDNGSYEVVMNLKNEGNSLSIVSNTLSSKFVVVSIIIKDWDSKRVEINTIKLSLCDKSFNIKPSIMGGVSSDLSFKDSKVSEACSDCIACSQYYDSDGFFKFCAEEWKRLLDGANGSNLCLYVTCIDMDSKVEREYLFRVSSSNFQKFVDFVMFPFKE